MERKNIEIPFGAFDSELGGFEYTIPEGYEAEIKEGKVIVKKKESEDERIIERIKKAVESYWSDEPLDEILAYLEKQGEQKPVDKVAPKFKVGDWVVYNRNDHSREVIQIYDIRDNRYYFNDNIHFSWSVKECDEKSHLWTIQDAKDGDVIYVSTEAKGIQAIFHKFENGIIYFHCYLCRDFTQGGYMPIGSVELVYPLQKTHCNKFFEKMHEAGYEWDAEKKELKKIEQSPSWSEEDEKRVESLHGWLDTLVNYIHHDTIVPLDLRRERMQQVERLKTWLKLLKEMHAWKPSDEQMKVLSKYAEQNNYDGSVLTSLYQELKKLKE